MSSPYPPQPPKRLERSKSNRILGGVCAGVANYLNMDPTLVRVLTVVISLFTGVRGARRRFTAGIGHLPARVGSAGPGLRLPHCAATAKSAGLHLIGHVGANSAGSAANTARLC
jgi:hypothetical protein